MTNPRFYRNPHSLHDVTGFLPAQVASLHEEGRFLHEQSAFLQEKKLHKSIPPKHAINFELF